MFDFDVVTGSVPWIPKPVQDDSFDRERESVPLSVEIRSSGDKAAQDTGRTERR
jgi:hypothetical protein